MGVHERTIDDAVKRPVLLDVGDLVEGEFSGAVGFVKVGG